MLKIIHQKILDKRWGVLAVMAQKDACGCAPSRDPQGAVLRLRNTVTIFCETH